MYFRDLAERFELRESFTEMRNEMEWVRHIYETAREQRERRAGRGLHFDEFWERGYFEMPASPKPIVLFEKFRDESQSAIKLSTPSGRIEIFSEKIAGFGYDDCLGHPAWLEPAEWLGSAIARELSAASDDYAAEHAAARADGHGARQPGRPKSRDANRFASIATMRPRAGFATATSSGCSTIAARSSPARFVSEEIRPGVVQMSTGAWYDPEHPGVIGSLDKHGNPNVLTLDKGTSRLAQGPSAQTTLVQIEKFVGEPPPVTAFDPPIA